MSKITNNNIPLGFGMALAQNEAAMCVYANLSAAEKQSIIDRTRTVTSKKEMQNLVSEIAQRQIF